VFYHLELQDIVGTIGVALGPFHQGIGPVVIQETFMYRIPVELAIDLHGNMVYQAG
jgi:hypothetical protein